MPIDVICVPISKVRLASLTTDERALIILAGHTMNTVTTWIKMLGYSAGRDGDTSVEKIVQSAQTLVLLRAFYASLVEADVWMRRPESQRLIGQLYLDHMDQTSREAYTALKKGFGRSNRLYRIRNGFSNHYPSSSALDKAFDVLRDDSDWSWYMSTKLSNSCWWACEAVVSRGVLNQSSKTEESEALSDVIGEAVEIANLLIDFVMGLLKATLDVHFPDLRDAHLVQTIKGAPHARDFFIPFFMES